MKWEPSDRVAGGRTQVLWKSTSCSSLQNHLSSPTCLIYSGLLVFFFHSSVRKFFFPSPPLGLSLLLRHLKSYWFLTYFIPMRNFMNLSLLGLPVPTLHVIKKVVPKTTKNMLSLPSRPSFLRKACCQRSKQLTRSFPRAQSAGCMVWWRWNNPLYWSARPCAQGAKYPTFLKVFSSVPPRYITSSGTPTRLAGILSKAISNRVCPNSP